jgi:hypothetical protein
MKIERRPVMAKKQKALSKKDKAMIKNMLVAATVYRLNRDPDIPMKQGMAVMRKYFKRINSWT